MHWRLIRRRGLKLGQYQIMRHVVPLTASQRRACLSGPKVFANSIPKAGTHLLRGVLERMPNVVPLWTYHLDASVGDYMSQIECVRRGQIVTAHLGWDSRLYERLVVLGFRRILMIRDLRDIAVSSVYYGAYKDKSHRLYPYLSRLGSDSERLIAQIRGIDGEDLADGIRSKSWGEHAREYLPWIEDSGCLLVRFEDLVGQRGGGDCERQMRTIQEIGAHIGVELPRQEVQTIAEQAFGVNSRTFRKGQIGAWRESFEDVHVEAFKVTAGDVLVALGYERGLDWTR